MSSEIDYEQTNKELIDRAQNGDEGAVLEIVQLNLGLIHQCASKFIASHQLNGYEYDDLVQEGIMGMLMAIKGYDTEKGMFSTYAFPWINNKMQRFVHKCNESIRKPSHMAEALFKIKNIIESKENECGYELEKKEIDEIISDYSKKNKVSVDILNAAVNSVCVSFSAPLSSDESATVEDFLADDTDIEEIVLGDIQDEKIKEVMEELINSPYFTDNDRTVIRKRFGYEGEPWTLQEIATHMNVTPEAVRKTEVKCVRRFREILRRNYKYKEIVEEYSL